ncbi:phospholipase D-like domain-containing protein, partial [bacterium]|nr:phospholipase D-like domain-containing protein [bacterium]
IKKKLVILLLAWCLTTAPVLAQSEVDVVMNVPVETNLSVPGVRDTADVWLDMINGSEETIELEQFYIHGKPGSVLEPVLKALEAAAKRGVKIRFLIDSQFYSKYPGNADDLAVLPNLQIRIIDFSPTKGIQHAKYFVVDSKEVFVGSANFDSIALQHVHEVGLRIRDQAIAKDMQAIFNIDWTNSRRLNPNDEKFQKIETQDCPAQSPALYVVASPEGQLPKNVPNTLGRITSMIADAKKSVQVQVYEYSTKNFGGTSSPDYWPRLNNALREAASRGVHVQLLVDKSSLKNGLPTLAELANVQNVEVKTVTIPEWSGGVIPFARLIHSKYMIVDEESVWLGSENWQEGYFKNSRNVGVISKNHDTAKTLEKIFEKLWSSSNVKRLLALI